MYDFDWKEAEHHQALAMSHEPVSPALRIGYSRHLMLTGRPMQGAEQARRMLEQDPQDRGTAEAIEPSNRLRRATARVLFRQVCSPFEEGATWAELAIEQRDPVAVIHLLGQTREPGERAGAGPS